jgi:hypothetical protein
LIFTKILLGGSLFFKQRAVAPTPTFFFVVQGVHYVDPQKIILAPPSTEAAAAVFFPSRPLNHKENRPAPQRP